MPPSDADLKVLSTDRRHQLELDYVRRYVHRTYTRLRYHNAGRRRSRGIRLPWDSASSALVDSGAGAEMRFYTAWSTSDSISYHIAMIISKRITPLGKPVRAGTHTYHVYGALPGMIVVFQSEVLANAGIIKKAVVS